MRHERALRLLAAALCGVLLCACVSTAPVKRESVDAKRQEAARIHTALGQKYLQQGKYEVALEKLNRALRFDEDYADAHTVIALLYERIGRREQAGEHYRRAAELRPTSGAELNNYAAFLCNGGQYTQAQPYFDKAIADPFYNTPEVALTNSGTCLLKAGKLDRAEHDLRLALQRTPDDAEALFQLAEVLYRKDDSFHARAFMQRFESVAPERPESLMLARNIELKLGNGAAAQEYTRKLLQGFPNSQQARTLLGHNSP